VNKDAIIQIVMDAVKKEVETNWKDELTDKQKDFALETIKYLGEESLVLALTEDETKKEFHRKNIEHYLSAIESLKATAQIKAYRSTINVVGRVLASIAIATGKAII
jgi:hypothetical protein